MFPSGVCGRWCSAAAAKSRGNPWSWAASAAWGRRGRLGDARSIPQAAIPRKTRVAASARVDWRSAFSFGNANRAGRSPGSSHGSQRVASGQVRVDWIGSRWGGRCFPLVSDPILPLVCVVSVCVQNKKRRAALRRPARFIAIPIESAEAAQHRVQHTTVAQVLDLDRRIDARQGLEGLDRAVGAGRRHRQV